MDALSVQYTGVPLTYISVVPNTDLDTILGNINTAVNAVSGAPNYSSYSLACVKQTDGVTHPTNTQNFAEGISKILCDHITTYNTFTGTTYPAAMLVHTNAINSIQAPAFTYTPFSITNVDTINTVWSKVFTGLSGIIADQDPSTANWVAITANPAPTTIPDAFDEIILAYQTMAVDIVSKEDALGLFDNSTNCLSGTNKDTAKDTIELLTSYACSLPTYNHNSITWGSVASAVNLQLSIQSLINQINYLSTFAQPSTGTGLTMTAVGGTYDGKTLSIDPTYTNLYKVKASATDGSPSHLAGKIFSTDGTITIDTTTDPHKMDLSVTGATNKVLATAGDVVPGYLLEKIEVTSNSWGISVYPVANSTGDKVQLIIDINKDILLTSILDGIGDDPQLLAKFCILKDSCSGCLCDAPTSLIVTVDVEGGIFDLSWVPGGNTTTQIVRYRQKGSTVWNTAPNITAANPQIAATTSATVSNLTTNVVYEFQVESNCGSTSNVSDVYEMILYTDPNPDIVPTTGSVNVAYPPLMTVDTVDIRLINPSNIVVGSVTVPGSSPIKTFTGITPGNGYKISTRLGTGINGVSLYSDDPTQANAWYVSAGFNVP